MGDATAVSKVFRVFFVFTFTYPFAPVVAQLIAEPNFNNCCQKLSFQSLSALSFQSLSASGPCEAEYDSKFFHGGEDPSTAEQREISDKVTQASWRNPSPSFLESDIIPAGILVTVAEHGLSYLKDVLVNQVLQEVTPLGLPNITRRISSPIGSLDFMLTDVILKGAQVETSKITLSNSSISIYASGVQAKLVFHWSYSCTTSYVPIPIKDGGVAYVEVRGGKAGVDFAIEEDNGTLIVDVSKCETYLEELDIDLHGGVSWLYKWFVYAFEDQIRSVMEDALTKQILKGVGTLDTFLLHLPRSIPIDDISAVDVTIVQNPILSPTYITVGVKGEFISSKSSGGSKDSTVGLPDGLSCSDLPKMVTIALSEMVLKSAAMVYYNAGSLQWLVDSLPKQTLLNTASWKYVIPQLYKKYPNMDMMLNFSVSTTPDISVARNGIHATAAMDMTVDVLNSTQGIPVACISLTISMNAIAAMNGNNITAEATLKDLILELKWSEIGSFPVKLVQAAVRTVVTDVILPLLNFNLRKGFPLPIIPSVELQAADIRYGNSFLLVCTDVHYTDDLTFVLVSEKLTNLLISS